MVIASLVVICGLHQQVLLNCTLDFNPQDVYSIAWTINNSSRMNEGVYTIMGNQMLILNCTQTFENSIIQCKKQHIFNTSEPDVLGDVYNIQIQGV